MARLLVFWRRSPSGQPDGPSVSIARWLESRFRVVIPALGGCVAIPFVIPALGGCVAIPFRSSFRRLFAPESSVFAVFVIDRDDM